MSQSSPKPHHWLTPRNLLWASIAVAVVTIALKTLAWVVTGSVGLLSDAMESFVNLASAMFALAMVTVAARPADDDHPYDHHKAEYFSSGFEGILIVGVSASILWAAGYRLFDPQPIEQVGWGLGLSVLSSALNGFLVWLMFRSAREYRSIALEADARHLVTDVWTSAGVLVGIVGAVLTGWLWLDAVAAIAVALNILKEGVSLVWRSSQGLMDSAVEPGCRSSLTPPCSSLCWPSRPARCGLTTYLPAAQASGSSWTCTCTCPPTGLWSTRPNCAARWSAR